VGEAAAAGPLPVPPVFGRLRLSSDLEGTTLWTAITGVKWNVAETLVVGGHLLWSMNDRGLTARVTPTVALEYSIR